MISSNTRPFIVLPILFGLTLFGLGNIWSKFNHHPSLIKECICDTSQSSVLASQCHIGKTEV